MARCRTLLAGTVWLALAAIATPASAGTTFHPRIGGALGIFPPASSAGRFGTGDVATGALTPVLYHGGSVMTGTVRVHTIFWAPAGYAFSPAPPGSSAYEALVKQFFTDVAADSGGTSNIFSTLPQFAQGTSVAGITPGDYHVVYNPVTDSIDDTNPYPSRSSQCASPNGIPTCVTDHQVQTEINNEITATAGTRGLHDIWFVFLPPNVDECIVPGACGSNTFAGYHSVSSLAFPLQKVTIYSVVVDPLIEVTIGPGADPQGNPDAEATIDTAAHEAIEAITDPEGVGWMDPNGYEVADKCEFGPQVGTPLGYASNGSPFNQVINGNDYLFQESWSNDDGGCVQNTTNTANPLPLPQVNLTQFSQSVSGNIGSNTPNVGVQVMLKRMGADGNPAIVAQASTATSASGFWQLTLGHGVGDDRDEIDVNYSGPGAPTPHHQVILTGNGGDPFDASGWTGWFTMDNGTLATTHPTSSVTLGPCFQTGVLGLTFNSTPQILSPTEFCDTQTDTALEVTPSAITAGDVIKASSNDNRAFQPPDVPSANPNGGLVSMTVPVGEADSVSAIGSLMQFFTPGGFPSCTGDLEQQWVYCTGLVPGHGYTLTDGAHNVSDSADSSGTLFDSLAIRRGDVVTLSNGSRAVTRLHVAHLRVDITAQQTALSSGTCEPGQYYGDPLTSPPLSDSAGEPTSVAGGSALTGEICPLNGDATGFDTSYIAQSDDLSGGVTQTEVPDIEDTSPMQGEIVYGKFTVLAESGLPGPSNSVIPTDGTTRIAVAITRSSGGNPVFVAGNTDTANGVNVHALTPGAYTATWVLVDANADTRTITTRFIEESPVQGPPGPPGPKPTVTCKLLHHNKIRCKVTFKQHHKTQGALRLSIRRGGRVLALGHGRVRGGSATITLRSPRRIASGPVTLTVVLSQPGQKPTTTRIPIRM